MTLIREWAESTLGGSKPKLIVEIGAHRGEDTAWLSRLQNARVHAFEPDPRVYLDLDLRPNVTLHRMAISNVEGRRPFLLSNGSGYTKSSSLKRPKRHLDLNPQVAFTKSVMVDVTTLDIWSSQHGIEAADLIWADIQGAEREMIEGGRALLSRTRWLYTEYSDHEEYEGQPTLDEILAMLPDWKIEHQWPYDVLLGRVA